MKESSAEHARGAALWLQGRVAGVVLGRLAARQPHARGAAVYTAGGAWWLHGYVKVMQCINLCLSVYLH